MPPASQHPPSWLEKTGPNDKTKWDSSSKHSQATVTVQPVEDDPQPISVVAPQYRSTFAHADQNMYPRRPGRLASREPYTLRPVGPLLSRQTGTDFESEVDDSDDDDGTHVEGDPQTPHSLHFGDRARDSAAWRHGPDDISWERTSPTASRWLIPTGPRSPTTTTVEKIKGPRIATESAETQIEPSGLSHCHALNVACPKTMCHKYWFGGQSPNRIASSGKPKSPGTAESVDHNSMPRGYMCMYVDPISGKSCGLSFKRRGCRDRHTVAHSSSEGKVRFRSFTGRRSS